MIARKMSNTKLSRLTRKQMFTTLQIIMKKKALEVSREVSCVQ